MDVSTGAGNMDREQGVGGELSVQGGGWGAVSSMVAESVLSRPH